MIVALSTIIAHHKEQVLDQDRPAVVDHEGAHEGPAAPVRMWGARLSAAVALSVVSSMAAWMAVVKLQQGLNPWWDTYAFLCNAMDMAGRSVGYTEPTRPPLLSFLTSLVMRAGVWNDSSILIIDVAMGGVGVLALYFLLSRRFPRWIAAAGSLLLIAAPAFWATVGMGLTDFASVALSICSIVAIVRATEDDPRWYWVAFPLWVTAFLMRFGALLVIVPIAMWLVMRSRTFRDAKYIAQGVLAACLAYLPAGLWFLSGVGDFLYPAQMVSRVDAGDFAAGGAVATGAGADAAARMIPGQWYIENFRQLVFPTSIAVLATVLLVVACAGLLVAMVAALARARAGWRTLLPVVAAVGVVAAQASGGAIVRILTIVVFGGAVAWATRPRANADLPRRDDDIRWALDALVLTWGLIFFDAHGHMAFQLDRYFLTMMPPVLYFLVIGWRESAGLLVRSLTPHPPRLSEVDTPTGAAWSNGIAAVVLAAVAAVAVFWTFAGPQPARDPWGPELAEVSTLMLHNIPDIRQKTVLSDGWPHSSYYLGQRVLAMQSFPDSNAWRWELEKQRADLYVTIRKSAVPGYREIARSGITSVWQRVAPFDARIPRVAYLGRGWDTYLEMVDGYDFALMFGLRLALAQNDWGLDTFSVEQLETYDAVAIYGATWDDREKAERTLTQYVERGGVVIIDASRNLSGLQNNLDDSVLLNMLIRRESVPARARITVEGGLTRASGSTEAVDAAPFWDEAGGPWYGAGYAPLHSTDRTEVLARLNGRPVVQLQRIGRGRVYWISDNLVWHAFLNEKNPDSDRRVPGSPESDIVRGVLRAALGLPPASAESSRGIE